MTAIEAWRLYVTAMRMISVCLWETDIVPVNVSNCCLHLLCMQCAMTREFVCVLSMCASVNVLVADGDSGSHARCILVRSMILLKTGWLLGALKRSDFGNQRLSSARWVKCRWRWCTGVLQVWTLTFPGFLLTSSHSPSLLAYTFAYIWCETRVNHIGNYRRSLVKIYYVYRFVIVINLLSRITLILIHPLKTVDWQSKARVK